MSNTAVFGIYFTRRAAEEAVGALVEAHFRKSDISALFPDNAGTKDLAHERNTKAPERAVTGAVAGVIAGGVLGWLAGVGTLAIPGVALVVAGPVIAALAGAGALGIVAGIIGALIGMATPEYEARRYVGRVRHGGVLLSVHCDNRDWVKRARQILRKTGGEDISAAGEAHADFAVSDKPMPRTRVPITEDAAVMEDFVSRTATQHEPPDRMNSDGPRSGTSL